MYQRRPYPMNRYPPRTDRTEEQKKEADPALKAITAEDIPLPSEPEKQFPRGTRPKMFAFKPHSAEKQHAPKKGLFKIFGKNIGTEELILFFLIVILLDEGLEDELFLILLLYIFFDINKLFKS